MEFTLLSIRIAGYVVVAMTTLGMTGCHMPAAISAPGLYRITDPTTGHSYRTREYQRLIGQDRWGNSVGSGAVVFVDLDSGQVLTLQNSAIGQLSPSTSPSTTDGHTAP